MFYNAPSTSWVIQIYLPAAALALAFPLADAFPAGPFPSLAASARALLRDLSGFSGFASFGKIGLAAESVVNGKTCRHSTWKQNVSLENCAVSWWILETFPHIVSQSWPFPLEMLLVRASCGFPSSKLTPPWARTCVVFIPILPPLCLFQFPVYLYCLFRQFGLYPYINISLFGMRPSLDSRIIVGRLQLVLWPGKSYRLYRELLDKK